MIVYRIGYQFSFYEDQGAGWGKTIHEGHFENENLDVLYEDIARLKKSPYEFFYHYEQDDLDRPNLTFGKIQQIEYLGEIPLDLAKIEQTKTWQEHLERVQQALDEAEQGRAEEAKRDRRYQWERLRKEFEQPDERRRLYEELRKEFEG